MRINNNKEKREINALSYLFKDFSLFTKAIIGLLSMIFTYVYLYHSKTTLISKNLFIISLIISAVIFIFYYFFLKHKGFKISGYHFFYPVIVIFFMAIIGIIFSVNYLFADDKIYINEYKIIDVKSEKYHRNKTRYYYPIFSFVKDGKIIERKFHPDFHKERNEYKKVVLKTKTGLLGIDFIDDQKVIK